MKIAVFGDIHSNSYALTALLAELEKHSVDHLIITGDIFGYYPWAAKTFFLLKTIKTPYSCIKGNHDQYILDKIIDSGFTRNVSYWHAIEKNLLELRNDVPEALTWLDSLSLENQFVTGKYRYSIYHGTPADPLDGRYYPDDSKIYDWFPAKGECIVLGHTHYPLIRLMGNDSLIINPGSVGQPRDGSINPSWLFIDEDTNEFSIKRISYDVDEAIKQLSELHWDERSIKALQKTSPGTLLV